MKIQQLEAAQTMITRWKSLNDEIPQLHILLSKLADGELVCGFEFAIKEPVDNSKEVSRHALEQLDRDEHGPTIRPTIQQLPNGLAMISFGDKPPEDTKMLEWTLKGNVRDTLMLEMVTCLLAEKERQKKNIENNLESLGIQIEQ